MKKHIVLVGFMGSGKTTVGQALSQHLGAGFVDLDQYIEQQEGKTIAQLFKQAGEHGFRALETRYLANLLKQPPGIIAAGGGTPCFNNNMSRINAVAVSVYLQARPELLYNRLQHECAGRPMLQQKTGSDLLALITTLLQQRQGFYELAQIMADASSIDIAELAQQIGRV